MVKSIRISILFLVVFSCTIIVSAQNSDVDKLDQYFQTLGDNNKFMGSISVFKDGSKVYSKSVGYTDFDKQIVANETSKYRIGSISKTFTAVMIFQAIESGKISLNETIQKYFPSINNCEKITIAHLLSHRSGIHNFTADEGYLSWSIQYKNREQMIQIIADGGSDFVPDNKAQYSNSNYVLLSYILESVYGKSYADILAKQITEPLSLKNTYLGKSTISLDNNECNSYKYFDKWRVESVTNPSVTLGAGGIVSTSDDLNKFADALFKNKLVSANSLSTMQSMKDNYGMGLFPIPFYSKHGYGHSGEIDGFHSMLIYFPEDRLSYAITSNGMNYTFNDIHLAVLSWAYEKPFDIPTFEVIKLNPEDLDKYTGVYSSSQLPLKITIMKTGNSLEGQGTGQPTFPLEPTSKHIFKFTQGGIVMEFNPVENTMILKQGGGVFYFKKD